MKNILFLFMCALFGCSHQKQMGDSILSVLNIDEDNYPTRTIDIHDIADVEYIALESSDSTVVDMVYKYISDDYVVASDFGTTGGNIYFFNRSGNFLWKFNKRGSGPGEFSFLMLAIVDFETEECYVNDFFKKTLYVYSFKGDHLRTIPLTKKISKLEDILSFTIVHNYDKEYLIGYNLAPVTLVRELPNGSPYYLINKIDGSFHPLNLKIRNGLTRNIYDGKGEVVEKLHHYPLMLNGDECWISELSCDTIYSLLDRQLVPKLVQNPSVHSTTPPLVVFPIGFNDYFFEFDAAPLSVSEKNSGVPRNAKTLVWNRLANQLERWELYNSDDISSDNSILIPVNTFGGTMKNCGVITYSAEKLICCYKNNELKGRLKEIASKLQEEDNRVIVYVKYNKEKIWKILTE